MKTPLFKPDLFNDIHRRIMKDGYLSRNAGDMWEPNTRPDDIAKLVNDELDRIIEAIPAVYGHIKSDGSLSFSTERSKMDTHKAVLFNIEELPKQPCKHEHSAIYDEHQRKYHDLCKHCGVELQAEWKAVK